MKINNRDITFVIPTNRKHVHTLDSVPSESQVITPTSKPLGRARNDGIEKATTPWIILCDDDIRFSGTFLNLLCELASNDKIIGLEAYYPSPFVIGRLMMFSKQAWLDIGNFDIRSHGDETEWCMRAVKKDYKIVRLSRDCVYHFPHTKVKPKSEITNLLYLLRKHPNFLLYILKLVFIKMRDSSYDEEYKGNH